jgi:carbon monoxide dehydrogenase subunit G
MKMSGEEIIAAPRQVVWDALNDPDVLKQCITGCEEIKKKSDTELEAKVTAKVGPVKASFVGAVKLSKLNPPRSYVISGEGKGGMLQGSPRAALLSSCQTRLMARRNCPMMWTRRSAASWPRSARA